MTYKIYAIVDENNEFRYIGYTKGDAHFAARRVFLMAHCEHTPNYNLLISEWARNQDPQKTSVKILASIPSKEELLETRKKLMKKHRATLMNTHKYCFFAN